MVVLTVSSRRQQYPISILARSPQKETKPNLLVPLLLPLLPLFFPFTSSIFHEVLLFSLEGLFFSSFFFPLFSCFLLCLPSVSSSSSSSSSSPFLYPQLRATGGSPVPAFSPLAPPVRRACFVLRDHVLRLKPVSEEYQSRLRHPLTFAFVSVFPRLTGNVRLRPCRGLGPSSNTAAQVSSTHFSFHTNSTLLRRVLSLAWNPDRVFLSKLGGLAGFCSRPLVWHSFLPILAIEPPVSTPCSIEWHILDDCR